MAARVPDFRLSFATAEALIKNDLEEAIRWRDRAALEHERGNRDRWMQLDDRWREYRALARRTHLLAGWFREDLQAVAS